MTIELGIDERKVLPNGVEIITRAIDPLDVNKNPGVVAESEARHVALDEDNVTHVLVKKDGGETGFDKFNPVQAAAHSHGNGHDRRLTTAMGYDYDQMAAIAGRKLAAQNHKVAYLAGYFENNIGRVISKSEVKNVIETYEHGPSVETTVIYDGKSVTQVESGIHGGTVVFDLNTILPETTEDIADKDETLDSNTGSTEDQINKDEPNTAQEVEPQPETIESIEDFLRLERVRNEIALLIGS